MAKDWVKKAFSKNKGALTKTAKSKKGVKSTGGIKKKFLNEAASGKYGKLTQKRASLAKTAKGFKK